MKILIIDDNQDTSTMLSKFLELKGHDCIAANDGRNGLALINSRNFDILLLDLAMPNFTGMDVLDELCKTKKVDELKIIVFTASSLNKMDENALMEKHVYSVLRKPLELKFLLKAFEE